MSSAAIRGGRVAIEIGADAKRFYAALNALQARLRNFGASISGIGVRMAGLGAAATAPLGLAVAQTANFQDTMAAVGAVTDATGDEFERLRKKALDLGASTSFTAQQVAEGMQALGQGGFTVQETLSGIDGALLLARAGMLDLGQATSIMVAVLRSFKMPTEDAAKVADILAKAANASNSTVEGLGEALSTVGGIAYTAGISLTELTAAIGILADRGLDGSEAGTGLRRVIIGLAQEKDKLKDLGVDIKDPQTGKLKPLKQIIAELRVAMEGMSDTDKIAKLAKIFDVFGANAIMQLMNAGDALDTLDQKLQDSEGSAADVAKKMDDTLGGSFRMFKSAVEAAAIAVGDALTGELRAWLGYFTALAAGIARAVRANQEWVIAIGKSAAGVSLAGTGLVALGGAIQISAWSLGGLGKALAIATAPLSMLLRTSSLVVNSFAAVSNAAMQVSASLFRAIAGMIAFSAQSVAAATRYAASLAIMLGNTLATGITIGATWAGAALAGLLAFIANVKAQITYYTGMLSGMVAITITRAGTIAGAWVATAGASLASFVSTAVYGISTYIASAVAAAAATVSSAATMAAAWLAPIAPVIAVGAAIAGIGYAAQAVMSSSGAIASSLSSMFGPLSEGFNRVLSDATAVFSDLYGVATTTFGGISDAIMAGDMAVAFDVLWAGLKAAWLRGQQGVMSYVDVFVEYLQNRWGDAVAWIAKAMTSGLASIERTWIMATGVLFRTFQGAMNKVMDAWDVAVGAIQKAIAYIRSFFDEAIDYDAIRDQIDAANRERKAARDRDVADSKTAEEQKLEDSRTAERETNAAIDEANQSAQEDRASRTTARAAERQAGVDAANDDLDRQRGIAAASKESVDIMKEIGEATDLDSLRELWSRAQELFSQGLISAERLAEIEAKLDEQAVDITDANAMKAQEAEKQRRDEEAASNAAAGVEVANMKNEVAGTFSATAAMMMGTSSPAERTARASEETARNTRKIAASGVVQA